MALTTNCDIYASFSEATVNTIFGNISRQRPSLFNYGTESFVTNPDLMCHRIETANGLPANQPLVALQAPIPVPGTGGAYAIEYCAQLTKLELDLHPANVIQLPGEIAPLADQSMALRVQMCAGIACPSREVMTRLSYRERYQPIAPAAALRDTDKLNNAPPKRESFVVSPTRDPIHCFCLDLFLTARLRRDNGSHAPTIGIELTGLEISDIKPDGLEQSLECLITATLTLGLLPRLHLSVQDVILSLGTYGNLIIGLTPISAAVPFNPSIANDHMSVFVDAVLN